jgi:hypothetical protein
MNGVKLMRSFIKNVVPNANINKIPAALNLVFDGGAFNGYYGLGVGMYVKELESQGLTTVKKVSGVSAGSVLALWYLLDKPKTDLNAIFVEMAAHFNKHRNLRIYKKQVREIVNTNIESDNLSFLNDRLYISYYDTVDCCRKTVSRYKNRKHLIHTIIKSSHIPFVVTDSIAYQGRYIDGVRPELFDGHYRTLFVQVTTYSRLKRMFFTGSEVNILHRLIVGVADANDFFTTGTSEMCSFTDEWSWIGKFAFCLREIIMCIVYLVLSKVACTDGYSFDIASGLRSAASHVVWLLAGHEHYS